MRAKVRMWSGRSPGGSWYWSVPNGSPPSRESWTVYSKRGWSCPPSSRSSYSSAVVVASTLPRKGVGERDAVVVDDPAMPVDDDLARHALQPHHGMAHGADRPAGPGGAAQPQDAGSN